MLLLLVLGDVLGYSEQATKCCSCAGYIKVFDAANHLIYTIERKACSTCSLLHSMHMLLTTSPILLGISLTLM